MLLAALFLALLVSSQTATAQDKPQQSQSPLAVPELQEAVIQRSQTTSYTIEAPNWVTVFPGALTVEYNMTLVRHGPDNVINATFHVISPDDVGDFITVVDGYCSYNAEHSSAYCLTNLNQDRTDFTIRVAPHLDATIHHYWNSEDYVSTFVENNTTSVFRLWLAWLVLNQ